MACRTNEARGTQLRSLRFRRGSQAVPAAQSRSFKERFDPGRGRRRRLFRSKGVVDGTLVAHALSRLVLSAGAARVVAEHQTSGLDDLSTSISDLARSGN